MWEEQFEKETGESAYIINQREDDYWNINYIRWLESKLDAIFKLLQYPDELLQK